MSPLVTAIALAAQALPADAAGWQALGLKYAQAGDYELAEPAFAEACRLEPRRKDACYSLGRARYLLNRFEGAIAPLGQSLANGEPEGRATLALAQAREALGEAATAEQLFRKAIALEAAEADLRYGMFLLRQGRIDEAEKPARRAVERNPESAIAWVELARVENQQAAYPAARDHLKRALELDPRNPQAHLLLGRVYQRLGEHRLASHHLSAAKAAPESPAPARP